MQFTRKTRFLTIVVGAIGVLFVFAGVASADEGPTEPGQVAESSVVIEVLPVHGEGGGEAVEQPVEEPILEPGDDEVVAIVHEGDFGANPSVIARTPGDESMIAETVTAGDSASSAVGGQLDTPAVPAESIRSTTINGWAVAFVAVVLGAAVAVGMSRTVRGRRDQVLTG